jgi:hypothetical protein
MQASLNIYKSMNVIQQEHKGNKEETPQDHLGTCSQTLKNSASLSDENHEKSGHRENIPQYNKDCCDKLLPNIKLNGEMKSFS